MERLDHLHEQFCRHAYSVKGNSKTTIRHHRAAGKSFFNFCQPTFENLTLETIEAWAIHMHVVRNNAPKTRLERIKSLRMFCKWLVNHGFLDKNPCEGMDLPKLPKKIPEHLPLEKAEYLLAWVRNHRFTYKFERTRAHAMIAMMIHTGIRKTELRNLEINHVDITHEIITVRAGKGAKDRIIPMTLELKRILESYLKDRTRLNRTCPYFFTALRHDNRVGLGVIDKLYRRIRKGSGIHFSSHLLRHTFAVMMLKGGCDIFSLSKMMGHSSIKTTTIYLTATTHHLRTQIEKHPLAKTFTEFVPKAMQYFPRGELRPAATFIQQAQFSQDPRLTRNPVSLDECLSECYQKAGRYLRTQIFKVA